MSEPRLKPSFLTSGIVIFTATKASLASIGKQKNWNNKEIASGRPNAPIKLSKISRPSTSVNSIRERIEGIFNEVQNTGRNLEQLLQRTVIGLSAHIIAKMTSHLLKFIFRKQFGVDVQTKTSEHQPA